MIILSIDCFVRNILENGIECPSQFLNGQGDLKCLFQTTAQSKTQINLIHYHVRLWKPLKIHIWDPLVDWRRA